MRGGSAQARRPAQARGRHPYQPARVAIAAPHAPRPQSPAAHAPLCVSRISHARKQPPRANPHRYPARGRPLRRFAPSCAKTASRIPKKARSVSNPRNKQAPPSQRAPPTCGFALPLASASARSRRRGPVARRIDTFRQKNGIARPHFAHKGSRERYDGGRCLQNQTGSARNAHGTCVSPQALRQRSVRAARRTELASHEKSPAPGTTQGRASSGETAVRSRQTRRRVRSEASEAGFSSQTSGRPGSPKRKPNCVERATTEGRRSSKRDKSPRRPTREHSARPNEPPREP